MSELLPCPFCRKIPTWRRWPGRDLDILEHKCIHVDFRTVCFANNQEEKSKKIDMWNTRTPAEPAGDEPVAKTFTKDDIVITSNAKGHVVAITLQDDDWKILRVLWEQSTKPIHFHPPVRGGMLDEREAKDVLYDLMLAIEKLPASTD